METLEVLTPIFPKVAQGLWLCGQMPPGHRFSSPMGDGVSTGKGTLYSGEI